MPTAMPTREQMIADLSAPSREQMIADLKGQQAAPSAPEQPGIMDKNINPLSGIPFIGGGDVSPNDMIHGAIDSLPAAGGIVGGTFGAGVGAGLGTGLGVAGAVPLGIAGAASGAAIGGSAGSALKDTLDSLIYGKQKPVMDSFHDALGHAGEQAAYAATGEALFQGVPALAKAALATKGGSAAGELVSGVPSEIVKGYADGAQRIQTALKSADDSTFRMGMAAKEQFGQDLSATRKSLGDLVTDGIKDSSASVSPEPIIQSLERSKAALSPKLNPGEISEIQTLIDKARSMIGEGGDLSIQDANTLKQHFQTLAEQGGGYAAAKGVSTSSTELADAARGAGAVTREGMLKVIPKSVEKALSQESTLYKIEANMNKSLLIPRKSAQGLISAGEGTSSAGLKNLADLQDMQAITGTNMVQPAQDIAAAQALGKYKFSPSLKGLGQPLVKAAIDGAAPGVGSTLGQAVMHGAGAMGMLKQVGEGQ